jgi:uncharacterized membrane protein YtjA (UPF0391 family)
LAADLTALIPCAPGADFVPRVTALFCGFSARNCQEHSFRSRIGSATEALIVALLLEPKRGNREVRVMLSWVVTFLIIALIAGILGFGGIAGASIEIAKVIFFVAVMLFLISAVVGLARGRTRV